ncbi:hypothetical protein EK21DRAFT_72682 [Setomelanomma holmii]|uniref:Zn(2)-C6 fungal-type domain-containing protein n=1 Tax=Setomelanomma holmii TaxID=210430 RepID=A0A9P4LJ11_9PLEO|nr:hypothetical protein EK21DRAFT_72682 [Setomelanomma holmii]
MDPPERWQAIAPASDQPGRQRSAPDSRKRRQAVAVACVQCRTGKAKCDGTRPRCIRCKDNDYPCQYDVAEGVSRAERMKLLRRDSMSSKVEEMERVLKALRSGSDEQASNILARLRLGERLEEVAKGLPSATSTSTRGPPSLLAQDSTGSGVSTDSTADYSDGMASSYRHSSRASYSPSIGHHPSWPGSSAIASSSQSMTSKRKQPAPKVDALGRPFLSILFDRRDYLLATSESEDGYELNGESDITVDPRLLSQDLTFDAVEALTGSPVDQSRSRLPSPQKEQLGGTMHVTHLRSRQHIVNAIRVHSNFSLQNLFGNLPLSSSIRTNNSPADIQDAQIDNISLPTWAMMTINTRPDPGGLRNAFWNVVQDATALLRNGASVDLIIERHPNIAALFDEDEFARSGMLSRWAASMVHSIRLKGDDFTAFASMYHFWYLMRWMISPSPETYEAIPEWLRPTPNQLFMPHINMLDFIAWPAFREFAVQVPRMQERMDWMMDMSLTINCDWSFRNDEAFRRDEETGLLDLCLVAKTAMRDLSSWSVGPTFRAHVSNADSYVRIRTEDY